MHEEGRSGAERNQISQRIEFPPKRALDATHPRDAAIEEVKDAGKQNEPESDFDGAIVSVCHIRFDDFGQRDETAKEVSRRKEVRQKINLQLGLSGVARR